MKGIRNIVFDLGGVILDNDVHLTLRAFADLGINNMADYFGAGKASSFFRDYELGKISDADFIGDLRRMGNLTAPDSVIIKAWNALLLDFPPLRIDLLRTLRDRFRLFLFSNTNRLHMQAFQQIFRDSFAGTELDSLFEKAYYSSAIGLRKPDREAYDFILRDGNMINHETLLVDDARVNIVGAAKAGLQTYWIEPGKTVLDIGWDDVTS
ncbi:MAG TPA: HAD family phosphatase [Puia sp.]|nr:HAD family phosphatase [Puia sp.]